ncbi:bile acid:sodium symporter [Nonomuraea gerenzanensis]|uniref:Arsenical-resistance protein ACR3 n=1 Tax=Nonomuraea gerenzanensis TaxID=93944 RepID=A0A1M4EDB6_9ACTN|nr:bile acid:sodium symporter [Nonomuraea gerenzanensis]UBU08563.1 bile acid:sodium symporter [Nonomuraea gerenzanensis]SBO96915.1 Arsenical-resistance protein ACR3 [Nonomuraea gerenzanensis]
MERHQVAVYVGAIAAGAVVGLAAPGLGPVLEHAINPVLAALLYVTFLQVPAGELVRSLRAGRFLAAALVVNFAVVPLVVAAMFAVLPASLPADRAVRLGVLLVLLTPCVDYVVVFTGLAGGDAQVPELDGNLAVVAGVVPFYVAFLVVMGAAGLAVARLFRLDAPAGRAIVFTGATRNSLVVLPLALALPGHLSVAGAVVVTQTLVEVVGMLVYVRVVPRLPSLR